jgi:hypothetical protein
MEKKNLLEQIEELKRSIFTEGIDKLRSSNIENLKKLNKLLKKLNKDE